MENITLKNINTRIGVKDIILQTDMVEAIEKIVESYLVLNDIEQRTLKVDDVFDIRNRIETNYYNKRKYVEIDKQYVKDDIEKIVNKLTIEPRDYQENYEKCDVYASHLINKYYFIYQNDGTWLNDFYKLYPNLSDKQKEFLEDVISDTSEDEINKPILLESYLEFAKL